MSKDYSFNVMPSVSISRSRFARKSQHKTSFNMGQIIPVYVDEVLPGDTRSIDMASLVRMSTPIAPIMDNIYLDFYAFFVPNRLVWVHWKEFMGENNASAGIPSVSYSVPVIENSYNVLNSRATSGSYADYCGLPINASFNNAKISALPFRGIALIYNEWFRNQNIIAPLAIQTGDVNEVIVGERANNAVIFPCNASAILKASKLADYFTKGLPYAQKGAAVTIPLGTSAPILTTQELAGQTGLNRYNGQLYFAQTSGAPTSGTGATYETDGKLGDSSGLSKGIRLENFVADLRNATAASINQLRYAFQLQKLLEKDALYGSRYWEILAAHFGIKAPDASLQRPEYLGGYRQRINIDQVLSTAGYDDTAANQEVGKPGANSVTGGKFSLFTKSFTEHGYLFILAVARHDQTYCQGINRMWTRQNRFDFYFPVFANLGAQEIKNKEIFFSGSASTDELVFGYQEAWAEYRYKPSKATGLLNPSISGSLGYWTLTNNFLVLPTLGQNFIEQDRDAISRVLQTGMMGPDFIADFAFNDIAVKPCQKSFHPLPVLK